MAVLSLKIKKYTVTSNTNSYTCFSSDFYETPFQTIQIVPGIDRQCLFNLKNDNLSANQQHKFLPEFTTEQFSKYLIQQLHLAKRYNSKQHQRMRPRTTRIS